jgi:hypothetical protein
MDVEENNFLEKDFNNKLFFEKKIFDPKILIIHTASRHSNTLR